MSTASPPPKAPASPAVRRSPWTFPSSARRLCLPRTSPGRGLTRTTTSSWSTSPRAWWSIQPPATRTAPWSTPCSTTAATVSPASAAKSAPASSTASTAIPAASSSPPKRRRPPGPPAQLKDHSLSRTYECLVTGNMKQDSGTVDAPIGRSSATGKDGRGPHRPPCRHPLGGRRPLPWRHHSSAPPENRPHSTRSGSTWPTSATPSWATRSTAAKEAGPRASRPVPPRHPACASSTPAPASRWSSTAPLPPEFTAMLQKAAKKVPVSCAAKKAQKTYLPGPFSSPPQPAQGLFRPGASVFFVSDVFPPFLPTAEEMGKNAGRNCVSALPQRAIPA